MWVNWTLGRPGWSDRASLASRSASSKEPSSCAVSARMLVAAHWWTAMGSSSVSRAWAAMSARAAPIPPDSSELAARFARPSNSISRSPVSHATRRISAARAVRSCSPSGPHTAIHRASSAVRNAAGSASRRAIATASRLSDSMRFVSSEKVNSRDTGDSPLRARLLARLSLEFTFSDDTKRMESLSLEAIAMARRLADPAALRTALDARWMAVWGPDGLDERTALAAEMLRVAWETGDREMELDGVAWRAASSLESDDIEAVRADIAAHARLTEELPMAVHQWKASSMRALAAQLDGSFEEAERLADEALSLQPGRPNVQFTDLDQVALLRWERGRLGELRDQWQVVVDRFPRAAFARAWLSLADAELGRSDDARSGLRALVEQIPQRPRNGIWLPAVALGSLLSARLNESEAAGALYSILLPYAGHIVAFTAPQPVVCLGSAAFYLGLLAAVRSRWAEAAGHFQAAIAAHDRLGARSFLARTRYEYARTLLSRGQTADRSRALRLLDQALPTASTLGMAAVAEGIQVLRAAQAGEAAPAQPARAGAADAEDSGNLFRREGEYWTVRYEGSVARLKDAKGLRYLARLLGNPGREFHAT